MADSSNSGPGGRWSGDKGGMAKETGTLMTVPASGPTTELEITPLSGNASLSVGTRSTVTVFYDTKGVIQGLRLDRPKNK